MIDIQLQILIIFGVFGFLIGLLLLSNGLLIHYLLKLSRRVARESRLARESSTAPINAFYNNSGFNASVMDLDAELNRRYREYPPTLPRSDVAAADKGDTKSHQSRSLSGKNSVISASEEFRWEKQSTIVRSDQQL